VRVRARVGRVGRGAVALPLLVRRLNGVAKGFCWSGRHILGVRTAGRAREGEGVWREADGEPIKCQKSYET
jgi:hypothetical protein